MASALVGCGAKPAVSMPRPSPTFAGTASYEDGTAAKGALIAIADAGTGQLVDVITTDNLGSFQSAVTAGKYALAAATDRGFAWVQSQAAPDTAYHLTLSRTCHVLAGHVDVSTRSTRINLERQSFSQGDTFVGSIQEDGTFRLCLPEGQYRMFLTGEALSLSTKVDVPAVASMTIRAVASKDVRGVPSRTGGTRGDLGGLVGDIIVSDPRIVGLGEATHGTAEFVSARGVLTFELIRHASVRLLLSELDAIASVVLDDYVTGADVDPAQVVAGLGFWTTDTHEFLRFLGGLRQYNSTTSDKVHIWGIDIQNTGRPVDVLVGAAEELMITPAEQAMLKLFTRSGKSVVNLSAEQRADLDALLARLVTPRGTGQHELLISVAARSLAMQLGYWTGDMATWLRKRRGTGMANLADFIVTQTGARRACLWAHDAHISKQPSEMEIGYHLSRSALRYYAIGFYMLQGSTRAVDAAGKIGVISFPIPRAPSYAIESAMAEAAGVPEIAWLPLRGLPTSLARWLEIPRFSRELGAVYTGVDEMMTLRSIPAAFDAIVIVKMGHDSSPTPTGVRIFKQ
jgi:erythromycin esterase-like protein